MSISLHHLSPVSGARTKRVRIGRGLGSGRGKTAGRGTKGQRARTGGRNKLVLKGLKQMLLGFPKMRGFQSLREKPATLPVGKLAKLPEGSTITVALLRQAGLIRRVDQRVKLVVGGGAVTKKFQIEGLLMTAQAKKIIEQAGGQVKKN